MSTEQQTGAAVDGDGGVRITHRPDEHRFVLTLNGDDVTHVEYVPRGDVWIFTHTYTEPAARGNGLAALVVRAALDGARDSGVRIRPVCPFVVDYLAAHPEYSDLVSSS